MVSVTFISRIWKGRYIVSVFLAFLCLGAGGWRLMHQWHYYDKTKVTPYLSMLKEPLKSVRLQSYMDGGSVGIELTSADGQIVQCVVPVSDTNAQMWNRVFIGSLAPKDPKARELSFPEDNKAFLIRMIQRYAVRDEVKITVLVHLRGSVMDYISGFMYSCGL